METILQILSQNDGDSGYPHTHYTYNLYDLNGKLIAEDWDYSMMGDYQIVYLTGAEIDETNVPNVLNHLKPEPDKQIGVTLTLLFTTTGDSGHSDTTLSGFKINGATFNESDDVNWYLAEHNCVICEIVSADADEEEAEAEENAGLKL